MKRIIVVGGSGFVGQACIKYLLQYFQDVVIFNLDVVENNIDSRVLFCYTDLTQDCCFEFLSDDIVIHLAARQYHPKPPRKEREKYFFELNFYGTKRLLEKMLVCRCTKMIYFSTDMVYGIPQQIPIATQHQTKPFGPYGKSKLASEELIMQYQRDYGFSITIFRPRMIVGKGRYGLLEKLFWLIEHNLPIPLIGSGKNCYQMVSVEDCAEAIFLAIKSQIPNQTFNLGSLNPPNVKTLLKDLIDKVDSRSILMPTYAPLVKNILFVCGKIGIDIMYEEQYRIADYEYSVDASQTQSVLGWMPKDDDLSMLYAAYEDYQGDK